MVVSLMCSRRPISALELPAADLRHLRRAGLPRRPRLSRHRGSWLRPALRDLPRRCLDIEADRFLQPRHNLVATSMR